MTQKLNLNLNIQAYSDSSPSTSSSLTNFKWNRAYVGSDCNNAKSESFLLNPFETKTLHNGVVALAADNTTTFDLYLDILGQYVLSYNSGTKPAFKLNRNIGVDATSVFIVSKNANVLTYTYSSGTSPVFTSVSVGDTLKVGTPFNVNNRGYYQVIAKSVTSVSVINYSGAPETATLDASFAQSFKIYSSGPLHEGQTLNILTGFSLTTLGSYVCEIIEDDRVFFSAKDLPLETNIQSNISAYSSSKKMIYLESDENLVVTANGSDIEIKPILVGVNLVPGVLLLNSSINSLTITNNGIKACNVFYASVE
jgi:hypothetical protein